MESVQPMQEESDFMKKLLCLGKYEDDIIAKAVSSNLQMQIQFNPGLIERIMRKEKTMERCMKYIESCAIKTKTSGCAGVHVDDATVYKWATEYFNTDGLEVDIEKKPYVPPKRPAAPTAPPKPKDDQISLFDAMENDTPPVKEAV